MTGSRDTVPPPATFALRWRGWRSAVAICSVWFVAGAYAAEAGVNVWTSHGPPGNVVVVAPDVNTIVINPANPTTLYIVAWPYTLEWAGAPISRSTVFTVFKSTDGGDTWAASGLTSTSISSLAIDPSTPSTLYAGTAEGLFKSTDDGDTWGASVLTSTSILSLAIDPLTPYTVYAGTSGGLLLKSTDGGTSWNLGNSTGLNGNCVTTMAVAPTAPTTLYAGTFDCPGTPYSGGYARELFKSTDGGDTWSDSGLQGSRNGIAIDPITPTTIYVQSYEGVSKSIDGGATWTWWILQGQAPPSPNVGNFALAIDPVTLGTLYAGTVDGVFKSTDAGENWNALGLFADTLAIDPTTPSTIYAGGGGRGMSKSTDAGVTWRTIDTGLSSTYQQGPLISALAIDPSAPGTLYAGADSGVSKSADASTTWEAATAGLTTAATALAIDPFTPSILYAGADSGVFKSTDAGATWEAANAGLPASSVTALAIDPLTPSTLYAGVDSGVFKSTDAGATWEAANAGLPANTQVNALAIDPAMPLTLYAGLHNSGRLGAVFKSTNAGATWEAAGGIVSSGHLLAPAASVHTLAIDPFTSGTLYANACFAYRAKAGPPCRTCAESEVFKSKDAGATWESMGAELTDAGCVTLVIDPVTPSTLYAGSSRVYDGNGVFKSTDAGATWVAVNAGFHAGTAVTALAIDPRTPSTVYAGTNGGVYSIQQISSCVGDCDDNGMVAVNELVLGINIVLGPLTASACPALANSEGMVDIAQLIQGVNKALSGCGSD